MRNVTLVLMYPHSDLQYKMVLSLYDQIHEFHVFNVMYSMYSMRWVIGVFYGLLMGLPSLSDWFESCLTGIPNTTAPLGGFLGCFHTMKKVSLS